MKTDIRFFNGLQKLYMLMMYEAESNLSELGLTGSEFLILLHISRKGAEKVQALGKIALISSGTTTYTVNKLIENKFVHKRQDSTDKRIFWIDMTEKGRKNFEKIYEGHMQFMDALMGAFSKKEKKQFILQMKYFEKGIKSSEKNNKII